MSDPGWRIVPYSAELAEWVHHASRVAQDVIHRPDNAHWFRCGGTWFAGVDCLPNDEMGQLKDGPPLPGSVLRDLPSLPMHPAQVSAIFPGYPQPLEGESAGAAAFRMKRDAAHVDGLLPVGPKRRRYLREPHAYILGLPLTVNPPEASPLVVWEGSHLLMAEAFQSLFGDRPAHEWTDIDVTDVYQSARRRCFQTCARVPVTAQPGEAILLHRLALHGMAPWTSASKAPRIIAYFRPEGRLEDWPSV